MAEIQMKSQQYCDKYRTWLKVYVDMADVMIQKNMYCNMRN
jgi:hypothetical protein